MADKIMAENTATSSRVIRDFAPFKLSKKEHVLTEGSGEKRRVTRLTGLVQRSNQPNENGRIYPAEVMKEAVEALQPCIENRMVLGELDHPDDAKIHTENTCILLTRLWMENSDVYAQFEILEGMPKGKMLKALIDQGVTVSISSRGVGDMDVSVVEGVEYDKVLPGFRFVTFDAVNDPSVTGTRLEIMESKKRQARKNHKVNERKLIEELRSSLSSK